MFSKRFVLFALPLAAIGILAALLALRPSPEKEAAWEPQLPRGTPFTLSDEPTGELWRRQIKSDTGKLVELHVGYRDGRSGVYRFDANQKLQSYSCYAAEGTRLIYQASFDADALIRKSQTFRLDGTLEAEYHRQLDGTLISERYAADGMQAEMTVVTLPDGSQRISRRNAEGKIDVEVIEGKPSEKSIGERLGTDGRITPIFKVKLTGVRVTDWEYYDEKAILRHRGSFTSDGGMVVTIFNDNGRPVLKQTWVRTGEDWNRAFYRVTDLEVYNDNGSVSARCKLNPDGITPEYVDYFNSWDNKLYRREVFDSKGFIVRQQFYYGQEIPTTTQEIPPGTGQQLILPAQLIGEPAGANPQVRVYRLRGTPFAETPEAEAPALPPLFVLP